MPPTARFRARGAPGAPTAHCGAGRGLANWTPTRAFALAILLCAIPSYADLSFSPEISIDPALVNSATFPGQFAYFFAAGDLDADGDADLVVPIGYDGILAWYRNLGGGAMSPRIVIQAHTVRQIAVVIADINSDSIADVALANDDSAIMWHRGLGGGAFSTFILIANYTTGASAPSSIALADVTGDGALDVLFTSWLDNTVNIIPNNGAGTFLTASTIVLTSSATQAASVAAADFDADGDLDVVFASTQLKSVTTYRNNGGSSFSFWATITTTCDGARVVMGVDMDRDPARSLDILALCYNGYKIQWFGNSGTGTFGGAHDLVPRFIADGIVPVDMDLDGDNDVVAVTFSESLVVWFENNGTGGFPEGKILISDTLSGASLVAVADLNGDGLSDVIAVGLDTPGKLSWFRSLSHGQARYTTAQWEASYATGITNSIKVLPRDPTGALGAACGVAGMLAGQASSNLVGQFANQNNALDGYTLPFVLVEPGEYSMRIHIDGQDAGLNISFIGYVAPPPVVCSGDAIAINASCVPCLAGSLKGFLDSGSVAACVCAPGYWLPNTTAIAAAAPSLLPQCVLCPAGAVCAGGSAAPVAAPGFFPESGTFIACPYPKACLGAGRCAKGYTGRLCGACASGWYSLNGRCYVCNRAQTGLIAFVIVLAALAVCCLLVRFNLGDHRHRFVAAMIALQALQISAMFGRLELDWGPIAKAYFNALGVVNIDWQLTSPECSISRSLDAWTVMWIMTVLLPLFAAAAIAAASLVMLLIARRFGKWTTAQVLDSGRRSWVQAMTLLYLPLISASYALFGCRRDATGKWILIARPSRLCYDRQWWQLFGPALFFALLYSLALPGLLFYGLRRLRASISAIQFVLRYGFLVGRFGDRYWFFEAVNMATKLGIVLCMTFFRSDAGRASAGVCALMLGAGAVIRLTPYRTGFHNWMASITTTATACVLFGGTVADSSLRQVFVLGGITVTVLVLTLGNAVDIYLVLAAERVAAGFFKAAECEGDVPLGAEDDGEALRLFGEKGTVKHVVRGDSDGKRHSAMLEAGSGGAHIAAVDSFNGTLAPSTVVLLQPMPLDVHSAVLSGAHSGVQSSVQSSAHSGVHAVGASSTGGSSYSSASSSS